MTASPAVAHPDTSVLAAWLVAAVCCLAPPVYRPARHAVTAIHEAGHAVVALAAGRALRSIRLHRDSSGETVSVGRARGPGVVATLLAGYPAPSLVGLTGVWASRSGHLDLWLLGLVVLLAGTLFLLRNVFGFVVTLGVIVGIEAVRRVVEPSLAHTIAEALSVFLLGAGVRGCLELLRVRGERHDAAGLARATGVPSTLWKLAFLTCAVASLAVAAHLTWPHDVRLPGLGDASVSLGGVE